MFFVLDRALAARFRRLTVRALAFTSIGVSAVALCPLDTAAFAQATRDSTADSTRVQPLEGVLVKAIRATNSAPIAQKVISRSTIEERHFGQDVPLLLQGASPSLTAHTETGLNWGYSYLRLRGIDQTRINITFDGVPLNDMEDQVLYFADFADLMSSVNSVQVQRGVGTSSAGTASFAGSINFESTPIAQRGSSGDFQAQLGSFDAQRLSAGFNSGLTASRFAVYGRASALRTNGYRDHSGVTGASAFVGAGWFGDRNIIKLTSLAGQLADTLSYTGATLEELAQNRRFNPLNPDERDKFGQQMVALAWTRLVSGTTSFNTTVYRNSASGSYDYFYGDDRYRYSLAHSWYGVTSAVNRDMGLLRLNAGLNANTYARDHSAYLRPDLETSLYTNTGHKQDVSAFVKLGYDLDRVTLFGDLQARHARFRIEPDARADVSERSIDWTFLDPKLGATYRATGNLSLYASFGTTSREPSRSDMFSGDDDLNATNVAEIGDLSRVKPERVYDTEAGVAYNRSTLQLHANVYNMAFRNDIAPIGAAGASGLVPRRNVGSSFRRGVEVDAEWTIAPRVTMSGNASVSNNRIKAFTDSSGDTPRTYTNVQPLLTPQLLSAQRLQVRANRSLTLSLEGRYQGRAFLDNTGDESRRLPDFYIVDAAARAAWSRYAFVVRGVNLGDTQKYGSGSVSSEGDARYFLLPARSVFVTAEVRF